MFEFNDQVPFLRRGIGNLHDGKGICAMQMVSWENGDATITDYPECSDRMLARLVQGINDDLAGDDGRLSPENALIALDLGHSTVGTSSHGLSDLDLQRVYVRCAVHAARSVLHLDTTGTALPAILAAEAWASDPTEENKRAAASAYAYTASAYAASAYAASAYAASDAAASYAADAAASYASDAYAYASDAYAYAHNRIEFRITLAREIIVLFKELTHTGSDYSVVTPASIPSTVSA